MLKKIFRGLVASVIILCASVSVVALISVLSYLCPALLLIMIVCAVLYLGYETGNNF